MALHKIISPLLLLSSGFFRSDVIDFQRMLLPAHDLATVLGWVPLLRKIDWLWQILHAVLILGLYFVHKENALLGRLLINCIRRGFD